MPGVDERVVKADVTNDATNHDVARTLQHEIGNLQMNIRAYKFGWKKPEHLSDQLEQN